MNHVKTHQIDVVDRDAQVSDVISRIITSRAEDKGDAFFCCSLSDIIQKYQKWTANFPQVQPYYSVKCNSDPQVLNLLAGLGACFSCTNKVEIKKALDLGVGPDRILFSNPCKQKTHIKYAAQHGVALMTFDSVGELKKIKATHPHSRLILCINFEEDSCENAAVASFGCEPDQAMNILEAAKALSLDVVGISLSMGSDSTAIPPAIGIAHHIAVQASDLGFSMEILDICGGFPGTDIEEVSLDECSDTINGALQKYFGEDSGVQFIVEPGDYFIKSAFTIAVNIIAKRVVNQDLEIDDELEDREPAFMYYVNDGIYGSFSCMLYDGVTSLVPTPLDDTPSELYSCSIWGPTCDDVDCLTNYHLLPELEEGDWLLYHHMGAHTLTGASGFNGLPQPKVHYFITEDLLSYLYLDRPQHANSATPDGLPKLFSDLQLIVPESVKLAL